MKLSDESLVCDCLSDINLYLSEEEDVDEPQFTRVMERLESIIRAHAREWGLKDLK